MRKCLPTCLLALMSLVPAVVNAAQEKKENAGPAAAQYQQIFAQWKNVLSQMRQLHAEHEKAQPQRKEEIEKQYRELIAQGDTLQPKLFDAAEKAFAEAPNADPELTKFLVAILRGEVRNDDYERAIELADLLMKHHCDDPAAANWAGIAAFAVNRFDDAAAWLKKAEETNSLDQQMGRVFLDAAGQYKTAWAREEKLRAAETKADDLPRVLLSTNKGDIEIELFENEAPIAVANFITLVEKGFYNGLTFHRVLANFMAQGGCPKGDGTGGPGYTIPCECQKSGARQHFRGSLSMAHAGRDTGGSQFFLTFVPTVHLNGQHTCFGRVVKGLEVLGRLQRRDPQAEDAPAPDRIREAKVLRKRNHPYEVTKSGNR